MTPYWILGRLVADRIDLGNTIEWVYMTMDEIYSIIDLVKKTMKTSWVLDFKFRSKQSPAQVKPESNKEFEKKYLGRKVKKKFEGQFYKGEVIDVDVLYSEELAKKGDKDVGKILYQIQYEDGDNEDVFLEELKEILVK